MINRVARKETGFSCLRFLIECNKEIRAFVVQPTRAEKKLIGGKKKWMIEIEMIRMDGRDLIVTG